MGETSRARRSRAPLLILAAALVAAACGSSSHPGAAPGPQTTSSTRPTTAASAPTGPATPAANSATGPERIPLEHGPALAAPTTAPGFPVDGIQCAPVEQLAYHIHAHLQVYVNGRSRSIPGAIGLLGPVAQQSAAGPWYGASKCYYWLHTHTSDGVIHIESPTARIYTLGDFFDEWGQSLTRHQVAGARGPVSAFVNGKPWTMALRKIPLRPHAAIQLDVGTPVVPFLTMSWSGTVL